MAKRYSASYLPIDVGFDLKRHKDMCIAVPPGQVEITFQGRKGKAETFTGSASDAVKALKRAGFCAIVKRTSGNT